MSFGQNGGPGIDVAPRRVTTDFHRLEANDGLGWPRPLLYDSQRKQIRGVTCPHCVVEGYTFESPPHTGNELAGVPYGEGGAFVAEAVADADGRFAWPSKQPVADCATAQGYTFTATAPLAAHRASASAARLSNAPVTSEFSPPAVCVAPADINRCLETGRPSDCTQGGNGTMTCRITNDFKVLQAPYNGLDFSGTPPLPVPATATVTGTSLIDPATGAPPGLNPYPGETWKPSFEGRRNGGWEYVIEVDGSGNASEPQYPPVVWRYTVTYIDKAASCPAANFESGIPGPG